MPMALSSPLARLLHAARDCRAIAVLMLAIGALALRAEAAPAAAGQVVSAPASAVPTADAASSRLGALVTPDPLEWVGGLGIDFRRTALQQQQLDALLAAQQDPASAAYQRWLSPQEFGQRFGPAAADVDRTTAWLHGAGLQVDWVDPAGSFVLFSGTVAAVERAFATRLRKLAPDAAGRTAYVGIVPIQVPAALADVIATTSGLSGIVARPANVRREVTVASASPAGGAQPAYTNGGQHYLAPDDLHTIYDYAPLFATGRGSGAGTRIAVIGQSEVRDSDLEAFRRAAGLPPAAIDRVLVPGTGSPALKTGDEIESDLDLEWAGASAPQAALSFVYVGNASGSDVFTALRHAVSQNVAPILALSYGACEPQAGASFARSLRSVIQQANAQGQTVFVSSGDSGVAACDPQNSLAATMGIAVNLPADIPEVTAVGGTQFDDSAGGGAPYWDPGNGPGGGSARGYIPEIAWNAYHALNSTAPGSGSLTVLASGGGASTLFGKPAWQRGPGVPADGQRDVPDVSLHAAPLYLVCSSDGQSNPCTNGFVSSQGQLSIVGGTSVATPIWAGILADIEAQGGGALGNINPRLYGLLNDATGYASAFHDPGLGDNSVPCVAVLSNGCPLTLFYQGYRATAGYDAVTGVGTPDVSMLAGLLPFATPGPAPTPTPATSPGGGGGGSSAPLLLAGLALAAMLRRRRRAAWDRGRCAGFAVRRSIQPEARLRLPL